MRTHAPVNVCVCVCVCVCVRVCVDVRTHAVDGCFKVCYKVADLQRYRQRLPTIVTRTCDAVFAAPFLPTPSLPHRSAGRRFTTKKNTVEMAQDQPKLDLVPNKINLSFRQHFATVDAWELDQRCTPLAFYERKEVQACTDTACRLAARHELACPRNGGMTSTTSDRTLSACMRVHSQRPWSPRSCSSATHRNNRLRTLVSCQTWATSLPHPARGPQSTGTHASDMAAKTMGVTRRLVGRSNLALLQHFHQETRRILRRLCQYCRVLLLQ